MQKLYASYHFRKNIYFLKNEKIQIGKQYTLKKLQTFPTPPPFLVLGKFIIVNSSTEDHVENTAFDIL